MAILSGLASRRIRWLWFGVGWFAVLVGAIGVVVPGLPSTVFFVVATWCFARSSPRFEAWVLGLPHVGRLVSDYRAGLGMPRRAKVVALSMIVVFSTLSAWVLRDRLVAAIAIGALGVAGVAYVGWRVPTREAVLAVRRSRT